MDIIIGRTANVKKDVSIKKDPLDIAKKKKHMDRRKNRQDRRKSVRDGVFVSLSFKKDRRVLKDRRKKN